MLYAFPWQSTFRHSDKRNCIIIIIIIIIIIWGFTRMLTLSQPYAREGEGRRHIIFFQINFRVAVLRPGSLDRNRTGRGSRGVGGGGAWGAEFIMGVFRTPAWGVKPAKRS